jgi:uncharacterized protein (TIGR02246 family)
MPMSMFKSFFCFHFTVVMVTAALVASAAEPSAEEKAVRQTAKAFTDAFNKGDAKAVAALWASDGDYSIGRVTVKGRDTIQKLYEEFFKAHPGSKMDVEVDSVRVYSPTVAVERGTASVTGSLDNSVYLDGQPIATAADYYQSAADLAETGEEANIPSEQPPANADPQAAPSNTADAQWLPLGVFEALQPDQKSSKMTFQISVNKDGIVRGNYYNTGDNTVKPIEGAVDKKTQRITWVVTDKDKIIFDTGLYNLTKDETAVLVHFSKDKTEQWTLVRLKQPQQASEEQ